MSEEADFIFAEAGVDKYSNEKLYKNISAAMEKLESDLRIRHAVFQTITHKERCEWYPEYLEQRNVLIKELKEGKIDPSWEV